MITIGYARVSKSEQTIENQLVLLREAGCSRIYQDVGISGMKPAAARPEFTEMLTYIKAQAEPVTLYTFEISRLGRNMLETLTIIKDLEEQHEVRVKSLSPREEWMNSDLGSIRTVVLAFVSWLAEDEARRISARTRAGVARARAEGKTLGRPRRKLDRTRMEEYRAQGLSWEKIARLEDVSTSTILRFIKREDRAGRGLA